MIWESRAICTYLIEKYGKTDSLYPKEPQKRAVVNQRLYFDMGTLYGAFAEYLYPQIFAKQPADPEKFKKLETAVGFLNTFLEGKLYAAADSLTVADIALVATISTIELAKVDFAKFPNVEKWYNNLKAVTPGYDLNQSGIEEFKKYLN